jgi:hypothetical protein
MIPVRRRDLSWEEYVQAREVRRERSRRKCATSTTGAGRCTAPPSPPSPDYSPPVDAERSTSDGGLRGAVSDRLFRNAIRNGAVTPVWHGRQRMIGRE